VIEFEKALNEESHEKVRKKKLKEILMCFGGIFILIVIIALIVLIISIDFVNKSSSISK